MSYNEIRNKKNNPISGFKHLNLDTTNVVTVPRSRGSRRGSLEQQQFSKNYYTEYSKEHDEYEEADVGALFRAGRRRSRPPPHRVGTGLAIISANRQRPTVTAGDTLLNVRTRSLGPERSAPFLAAQHDHSRPPQRGYKHCGPSTPH
ncbi:jg17723 [Pararge aegeria aegeria]|uniref:Jg17723 protein n=1 Tax=Pararge aegeria aegeria TaxID=348720 RepID=A0A8S4SEI4_9NEOP|nr:jg17723 [Pararge aegeria aegeria]